MKQKKLNTKLPNNLKLWSHNLEIRQEKDPHRINNEGRQVTVLGASDYDDVFIMLKEGMQPSREVETLIHELFHQIGYYSNTFVGCFEHEERIVDTLANGFTLILKDNPNLINYIKGNLHGK